MELQNKRLEAVRLTKTSDMVDTGNFPQGCSFSPDGLCVLTSTVSDNELRLYNTMWNDQDQNPIGWKTALSANGGDTVRSYAWYPAMNSADANTCCFLGAARDQPVHLYDAYTSKVRATYRPFNALDELESPSVVSFSPDGQRVYATGFKSDRTIHVFDTNIPGRDSAVLRLGKTRRSSDGQKGLVSAIAFSPTSRGDHVFCVGTYAPGSIYVYDDRMPSGHQASSVLNGLCVVGHGRSHSRKKRRFAAPHDDDGSDQDLQRLFSTAKVSWFQIRARGGVTQLQFSPSDDYKLYSASRRSGTLLAWDLRMVSGAEQASIPVHGMASYETDNDTNQRLGFDLDNEGKRIFVGGRDQCVRIYDTVKGSLLGTIDNFADAVNGVSYYRHEASNMEMLAVAVGARRFQEAYSDSADECDGSLVESISHPGGLELYKLQDASFGS